MVLIHYSSDITNNFELYPLATRALAMHISLMIFLCYCSLDNINYEIDDVSGMIGNNAIHAYIGWNSSELAELKIINRKYINVKLSIMSTIKDSDMSRKLTLHRQEYSDKLRVLMSEKTSIMMFKCFVVSEGVFCISNKFVQFYLGISNNKIAIDAINSMRDSIDTSATSEFDKLVKSLSSIKNKQLIAHSDFIVAKLSNEIRNKLTELLPHDAFKKLDEVLKLEETKSYPKHLSMTKYRMYYFLKNQCNKNSIVVIAPPRFSSVFSLSQLARSPSCLAIMKFSDDGKKNISDVVDSLESELFILQCGYELENPDSQAKMHESVAKYMQKSALLHMQAEQKLKSILPTEEFIRLKQLQCQVTGIRIAINSNSEDFALSETQLQSIVKIEQTFQNLAIVESREKKNRSSKERYNDIANRMYDAEIQIVALFDDKQKATWKRLIGERLSKQQFAELFVEYQSRSFK